MEPFLEDYTLLSELGQGGYATVYKVRHNKLGYTRAVRVLNAIIATGESDKTYVKFLEECKLLLRLGNGNHPNIVHIYQPLLRSQRAIVEMDYVDGDDLYHYLHNRLSFIELADVIQLAKHIGSALAYCHEEIYKFCMDRELDKLEDDPNDGTKVLLNDEMRSRLIEKYGVIHNDIHSRNIIRREDGSYVLLDFGLAVEGDSVVRSSRRKNGAPEFKSPEKWENDGILTTQSDMYSFGIVLYEYLAGRVPFPFDIKNSNSIEAEYLLGKSHKSEKPTPIFELRKAAFERVHPNETYVKDYPDWLETLIMKCLEKDPRDRYVNGKEFYEDLQRNISIDMASEVNLLQVENKSLKNRLESLSEEGDKEAESLNSALKNTLKDALKENERLRKRCEKLESSVQYENLKQLEEKLEQSKKETEEAVSNVELQRESFTKDIKRKKRSVVISRLFVLVFAALLTVVCWYAAPLYQNGGLVLPGEQNSEQSKELQTKLDEVNQSVATLQSQITALQTEKSNLESGLTKATTENSQLQANLEEYKNSSTSGSAAQVKEIQALKKQISTLEQKNKGTVNKSELTSRDKTIETLNKEIASRDKLIKILNKQMGVN